MSTNTRRKAYPRQRVHPVVPRIKFISISEHQHVHVEKRPAVRVPILKFYRWRQPCVRHDKGMAVARH